MNCWKFFKFLKNFGKFWEILGNCEKFCENFEKFSEILGNSRKFCKFCKFWELLGNLGKNLFIIKGELIGADFLSLFPEQRQRAAHENDVANGESIFDELPAGD